MSLKHKAHFGYAFAIAAVCLVYGLRLLLVPVLGSNGPLLMFYSPVILSALFYGVGPGLVATLLGGFLGAYYFMTVSFWLSITPDFLRLAFFAIEGILVSLLGGLYRSKKQKLSHALIEKSNAMIDRERANENTRRLEAELARMWRVNTMGEMAASLAHQLGHPIASIMNYTQALLRISTAPKLDDVVHDTIEEIAKEAQMAAGYVNSLRAFIKHRKPNLAEDTINCMVMEVASLMSQETKNHGVVLRLILDPSEPKVLADRIQIEQVILNLLRNGIDAMAGKPARECELLVETASKGQEFVQVSIRDQGCGILPEDLEKIFKSFYSSKPNGMGMGLAISRSIIEAHSGHLWVNSAANQRTTFYFTLPRVGGVAN